MEANCATSCFEDQGTEEFCFEVPITNVSKEKSAADVLCANNNVSRETSKSITNSEPIVIEETDDRIDDQKCDPTKKDSTEHISIAIDDEEKDNLIKDSDLEIADIDARINSEIIDKNAKSRKEKDTTTIDVDKETDNVTVCSRTDSDVIILDGNKTDSETTIILNDDEINDNENEHTDVIDVEKDTDCSIVQNSVNIYTGTDNEALNQLIHKCLNMKNSEGMPRVINRTLLVIYKDIDERYKKSDKFKNLIYETITQLNIEPERKFSHIKNLCDNIKLHKTKKRVPFITLDNNKEKSTTIPNKRRKVVDIIDLDDDTNDRQSNGTAVKSRKKSYPAGKVYPSIELDSSEDDVLQDDNDAIVLIIENEETVQNSRTVKKRKKYTKLKKIQQKVNKPVKKATKITPSPFIERISLANPDMFLEPRTSEGVEISESNRDLIDFIESNIARLKLRLEKLEETEVLSDTRGSPYLVCEQIKTSIVDLYKQLCLITGTEATKRHEVRLQVVSGHPEGPVRCLEEFLNENIDEDGNPPFPDISDVLGCVLKANSKYSLCWTPAQVMIEARALFTQFGQTMQKRRQKREWKDLMSLVKREVTDPADEDPALQARLEENKRIAKRNELDVLDRYAKMEQGLYPSSDPGLRLRVNESEESDENIEDPDYDDNTDATHHQVSQTDMTEVTLSERVNGNVFETDTEDNVYGLKITNVSSDSAIFLRNKLVGDVEYGSTATVSSGRIIVQPTIQYANENTTCSKPQASNLDTPFVSEYSRFLNTLTKPVLLPTNQVPSINTKTIPEKNSAIRTTKCTETDFEIATKFAEDILNLVQSDLHLDLASDKLNDVNNAIPFNPAVRLTNPNLNDSGKNNMPTTIFVHSALNSDNSNAKCEHSEILTHSPKDVDTNENITQGKELNKTSENIDSNENEINGIEDVDVENVVKPEPLDIPSMLEELGEDFTATIFDIEDPFLVIEISDSSESEDENHSEDA